MFRKAIFLNIYQGNSRVNHELHCDNILHDEKLNQHSFII